jgi:hypothetical protein
MVWTSLFGIITLVLLARALGFSKVPRLADTDEARRIATDALPGFGATDAVVAQDSRGGLVRGHDGRVALVRPFGDRWVVRVVNGAQTQVKAGHLRLTLDEAMFPPASLELGAAAATWAERL